jgi:DNA-binding protein HU-beta
MATLSKADLVSAIAEKSGKTKADTKTFLDAFLDTFTDELVKGNEIAIIGFANFKVEQVAERQGRNPGTGQPITIPAKKAVKVTIGKSLKDAVNT